MNKPDILFAFRKVFFEDQWHFRCINCGLDDSENWEWDKLWSLRFSSANQPVTISRPPGSCEISNIPLGPAEVYGRDPVIEAASVQVRTRLLEVHNQTFVVSSDDCRDLPLPSFLCEDRRTMAKATATVEFFKPYVEGLPEALAYQQRDQLAIREDPDLALFAPAANIGRIRIPVGLLLPAIVNSESSRAAAVYSVKEWQSDNQAIIEYYISDSRVNLKSGAMLTRQFRLHDGPLFNANIGTFI